MENQSDIYRRMQEVWEFDQLEPEERIWHLRTHRRDTTLSLKMKEAELYPNREVDESEQVRQEDEYLLNHGVK